MRYFKNDYDTIYETCCLFVRAGYKNMSEEWYEQKIKEEIEIATLDILKTNIQYNLRDNGLSDSIAKGIAREIVDGLPKELHVNLNEWIDDKVISDIKYNDLSINEIMDKRRKLRKGYTFIECAEAMVRYVRSGGRHKSICYNYPEIL